MAQPVTCTKCRRPFNAQYTHCPFCKTEATGALPQHAALEKQPPRRCVGCQKPYNATFAKCPFCGLDANAEPPPKPAASPLPNWAELANALIERNRPLLALEFHPAALMSLDAFFDITWGTEGSAKTNPNWKPNEAQSTVIVHFGAFYGELYRREFGGRWEVNPNELLMARVLYANRYVVPIAKVYKRLLLGENEGFEKEYLAERLQLGIRGTPEEADGWLRQAQHFASVKRPDLAGAFCARGLALNPIGATKSELSRLGNEAYRLMQNSS